MPDPTNKRTALIEALGHAICIADMKERIAATVDAIVAIVDERVAELRAIEAEGGETPSIVADMLRDDTAAPSESEPNVDQTCGNRCLDCGIPSGVDGPEPMALIVPRKHWLRIHPDDAGFLCARCMIVRASRLPGALNVTGVITFSADYDDGKEHPYDWATRRVDPHAEPLYNGTAPSEEGEGPDVWINLEMGRYVEKASRDRYVYDACDWERRNHVRYVPAAAAERRIAELERDKRTAEHQRDVLSRNLARIEDERDEYRREWESACERLRADPHNSTAWQEEGQRQRERIAELEAERDTLKTERGTVADGPRLFVNFNMNGAAIDVFHDRGEAERRPGHGDIREYVPAASVVGLKAQLIAAFVPEGDREACAAHPLARVVQHAIEHHQWHHDAQDSAYVARVEAERDAAVKRAEEAEAKLSDATAALKKAGEAIDILRKGPLVLR